MLFGRMDGFVSRLIVLSEAHGDCKLIARIPGETDGAKRRAPSTIIL